MSASGHRVIVQEDLIPCPWNQTRNLVPFKNYRWMNLLKQLSAMSDKQHHSTLVGTLLVSVDLIGQGGVRHQQVSVPRRVADPPPTSLPTSPISVAGNSS